MQWKTNNQGIRAAEESEATGNTSKARGEQHLKARPLSKWQTSGLEARPSPNLDDSAKKFTD